MLNRIKLIEITKWIPENLLVKDVKDIKDQKINRDNSYFSVAETVSV